METRTERVYHDVNGNPGVSTPGGRQQPQTAKELPKTGDTGTLVGILGSLLMGGGLAGLAGLKRKKRQK